MTSRWVLNTARSTYAVSLALDDTVLVLDYFGPATDLVPAWEPQSMPPIMSTFADYAPVEFAALGTRNVHGSELIVEYPDAVRGSRFRYVDHRFDEGAEGTHLAVRFADERGLEVEQHIRARSSSDVVERWVVFRDARETGEPIRLARAFTGAVSINAPAGARIDYLAGGYLREMFPRSVDLEVGTLRIGSRQGLTSHLFAPTMSVRVLGHDGEPDPAAGVLGIALAWSGSWAMQAEAHPNGLVRVSAGLDDEGTTLVLTPGREIESPRILALHTSGGPDELARAWHRYQRTEVLRSTSGYHRPVVYNSWEATELDVRADHQLELADVAAELGAEVFVVDDGWFAGRIDGNSGLGDWTADPGAFLDGLAAFGQRVIARGLRFGLWIEPEGVSPDSDLLREHPNWVYEENGLPQAAVRSQYVLDLGNPAAYSWIERTLRRLLTDHPITYLKWDMTRPVTSPGSHGGGPSFEWSLAHTHAYYRLLEMIRREFPHVTVEGCAGGGGRVRQRGPRPGRRGLGERRHRAPRSPARARRVPPRLPSGDHVVLGHHGAGHARSGAVLPGVQVRRRDGGRARPQRRPAPVDARRTRHRTVDDRVVPRAQAGVAQR
ncbi:alpha-galactosidase [Agromyces ramosus]|uniref:alpha-galactosidase n=1 Tax=Agromyces ramosus TaxID=33879 RepID=A0ABU0R899_9MICO|nr:alpha-galactosidase [Agromyces ramosus]MDQ0893997.1 alpha-galactosidase [Agromyces ramosus]